MRLEAKEKGMGLKINNSNTRGGENRLSILLLTPNNATAHAFFSPPMHGQFLQYTIRHCTGLPRRALGVSWRVKHWHVLVLEFVLYVLVRVRVRELHRCRYAERPSVITFARYDEGV